MNSAALWLSKSEQERLGRRYCGAPASSRAGDWQETYFSAVAQCRVACPRGRGRTACANPAWFDLVLGAGVYCQQYADGSRRKIRQNAYSVQLSSALCTIV